jgi:glycerophosphoryl diester phosphodiesterase
MNRRHLLALVPLALWSVPVPPASGADWPEWSVAFIAHRGGIVPGYPENTMAAFRQAIAQGVQVIEVDLRGTKDGEVVVMHDETLDRTTDGRGPVASRTLAELKQLDAGRGERIPTYSEVLQLVAGTGVQLLLDIKQSPVLDRRKVVRLTDAHDASLKVIVGARTVEDLRTFRALNPNLRTLGFVNDVKEIEAFVLAGVDIIRLWPDWIYRDPALVGQVQALGKPVWTTAGDASRDQLERLIKLGVNGILSDFPTVTGALGAEMKKGRGR